MVESYDRYRQQDPVAFAQSIAVEHERFGHILDDALTEAAYTPAANPTHVLLPACGVCIEAPVLIDRLGGPQGARQVHLSGIDIIERRIKIAREITADLPGNHTFITGGAEDLSQYPDIPAQFDIALFRRQNCGGGIGPQEWQEIFKQAMDRLALGGVAIVTSLNWDEHIQMIRSFQALGHEPTTPKPILTRYHRESRHDDNPMQVMPIDFCYSTFRRSPTNQ